MQVSMGCILGQLQRRMEAKGNGRVAAAMAAKWQLDSYAIL